MKYLVTGGCGFIGSHLVDRLIKEGHEVDVIDNLRTGENINEKAKLHVQFIESIDKNRYPWFYQKDYDTIFHLAGESRIQPSFEYPEISHKSNVDGTEVMCGLARETGAKIVYAGSSSVYHYIYANPYTFTKHIAEEYLRLYNKVYDIPVAIARFFNVYGPRQLESGPYSTVIGIFERQTTEGRNLTVTGNGEQRRDFTHVYDIVDGLIKMSEKPWDSRVFNLGTGKSHSINEVAKMFGGQVEYIDKRRGEAQNTLADIIESKQLIGYKPRHCLEDYIQNFLNRQKKVRDCEGNVLARSDCGSNQGNICD